MSTNTHARSGRAWAYLGAFTGGAVSIAANIAHTYVPPKGWPAGLRYAPHQGAVVSAGVWPSALLIVIEIMARVPWPKGAGWALLRFAGFGPVALVAGIVSYRHLSGLLAFYGEDPITHTIGPLAVDGLMVMATGALIATGAGRAASVARRTPVRECASAPDMFAAEPSAPKTSAPRKQAVKAAPAGVRSDGAVTAAKVAAALAERPEASTSELAEATGVSDRTVRRHVAALSATAGA